jgi:ADP-heptose:LPS heptosyltransferase
LARKSSVASKQPGRGSNLLRSIDRCLGVPALVICGVLHRKRELPRKIARLGILTTAAMGDTILLSAVVADLRAALPDTSITFFAGESNHSAASLLSGPDAVVLLPVQRPLEAVRIVREKQFDVLLDFGPWPRINALITFFSGARFTAGFRTPRQYRHYGYDLAIEHSADVHEIENHRRFISTLGFKPTHPPMIDPGTLTDDPGIAVGGPYVVFHLWPGGTCSDLKEWPVHQWIRLANQLTAERFSIVLTGGPTQRDANDFVIRAVDSNHRNLVHNAAGLKLSATAALIAGSRMVVSVDTGVLHLAAALNLPLVGLHGPTHSKRWGAVSDKAISIDSPAPKAGYLNLGFERPAKPPKCMEAIAYETVMGHCRKILSGEASSAISQTAG